jgi:hypothetical protein
MHEMHCGCKDDATYAAFSADVKASAAPAPKTEGEVLKEQLKMLEIAESSGGGGGAGSAGANVAFPLSVQAKASIAKIHGGSGQWITAFNVSILFIICCGFLFCFLTRAKKVSGAQIDAVAQAPPALSDRSALASSAAAFLQVRIPTIILRQRISLARTAPPQSTSAASPAFVLIVADGAVLFVYWCPDAAPVRSKMTHRCISRPVSPRCIGGFAASTDG